MYIVTTCLRPTEAIIERAERHALLYNVSFIPRRKHSMNKLMERYSTGILVFDKRRTEFLPLGASEPFFFHPSSSVFRIKQLLRDGHDPLVDVTAIQSGDSVLDCTLGLGSDSIVLSHAAGPSGKVTGLESEFVTAMLVKEGMATWEEKEPALNEAMRRITVIHSDALTYLKACETNAFDVIYFDPMFEKTINESVHLNPLRLLANDAQLTNEIMEEAQRVAKKKIVLKAHFESNVFEQYDFQRVSRKTSKFHYGFIDQETRSN